MGQIKHIPNRQIRIDDKKYLYFGGTAYLGLQSHPPFKELFIRSVEQYGMHYGASRKANISLSVYDDAEKHLSEWVGSEACLTMSSGYLAAQLLVQYLIHQGHTLFAAPNAHAALDLIGVVKTYSFYELRNEILKNLKKNGAKPPVVLFDTIDFSGQQYPNFEALKQLPLEKIIFVGDDSHGIGIVGKHGEGCYSILRKLNPAQLFVCCSLGKGLGVQSGAVFGQKKDIEKLKHTSLFGGASPTSPAFMGTLLNADAIYTERREKLMENLHLFNSLLKYPAEFSHMEGHPTFEFNNPQLATSLKEDGFIITNFNYPETNGPLISRIVLSAYHTKEDVQQLTNCLNTLLS